MNFDAVEYISNMDDFHPMKVETSVFRESIFDNNNEKFLFTYMLTGKNYKSARIEAKLDKIMEMRYALLEIQGEHKEKLLVSVESN